MKSFKRLYPSTLLLLLVSLGCQYAARLSPLNYLKSETPSTLSDTPLAQDTVKRPPSATPSPTATPTPTSTPNFQATSAVATQTAFTTQTVQARPMSEQIQKLKAKGYLSSTAGAWRELDNFDQNLSETTGYHWWKTGLQPVDFVIQANVEWWSANESSQLFNAGCGFIFRSVDKDNRLAAILTLDGRARYDRLDSGEWRTPILSNAVPVNALNDRAQLMLIVEGNHLTFLKDDVELLSVDDDLISSPKFQGGDLAFTIISNTDIGFGTHCKLTDIELWIIR